MPFAGELAALATALFWSFTSTFFTLAGRQVGSLVVNRIRLLLAVLFLSLAHVLLRQPLPTGAEPWRWFWLGLSGLMGLVLGDAFLFQAFIWIGPRLSMLMLSLAPIFSTFLAWIFLGEHLSTVELAGIGVTLAGISWVVLDRSASEDRGDARRFRWGLVFGLGAAIGQAAGYIAAKKGLAGDFSALSGTLMRMVTAAAILWSVTLVQRQVRPTFDRLAEKPRAMRYILGGAFFGPFLGVTLSLVAVQRTQVGIASTLLALPPIFLLPISHFVFKERIGWGAVAGTLVATAGVAIMALA